MATDKSIQQVINELNYEIIQLKYKNETNVTMRIDAIIEYLEGIKDDVIKIQSNQKFDLHRTATNCTITILDEDNEPITDGSNKLSFGDVIKISAVASTNYENPTIKVNGVSFTSGNTLVVKTDLTIVGVATGVPYDLSRTATNCTITVLDSDNNPITDGENKIKYGDTIKISAVASEGYENATLTVNDASFTSGNTMTVTGDVVIVGSASAIPVATPFAPNDVLSNGDKIHFDTTKGSEFATYLAGANFHDAQFNLIDYGSSGGDALLSASKDPETNTIMVVVASSNSSIGGDIVFATASGSISLGENNTISWNEGFNNLDGNGDYTLSLSTSITIYSVNDTTPPTWNGVIISKG